jgi:hypothetical protein
MKFGRDVLVNVIAGLIATTIIFLVAKGAGFFVKASPRTIGLSLLAVIVLGMAGLLIVERAANNAIKRGHPSRALENTQGILVIVYMLTLLMFCIETFRM